MNSDLLALCLTVFLAIARLIYSAGNRTYQISDYIPLLVALGGFWFCVRGVCDVLTWKKYIRGWAQGNGGIIYVSRKEQPFLYVVFFLTFVAMSTFLGFLVMISSKLGTWSIKPKSYGSWWLIPQDCARKRGRIGGTNSCLMMAFRPTPASPENVCIIRSHPSRLGL